MIAALLLVAGGLLLLGLAIGLALGTLLLVSPDWMLAFVWMACLLICLGWTRGCRLERNDS